MHPEGHGLLDGLNGHLVSGLAFDSIFAVCMFVRWTRPI